MQYTCSHVHRSLRPAPLSSDGSHCPSGCGDAQRVLIVLVPWRMFSLWIYSTFGLVLELGAAKTKSWASASCPSVTWEEGGGCPHQKDLVCFNPAFCFNQKYPLYQHRGLEVGQRKIPQVAHPVFCWIIICRACAVLNKMNDVKLDLF